MAPVSIAEVGDLPTEKHQVQSLDEVLTQLQSSRDSGNAAFKSGDLKSALSHYSKGIDLRNGDKTGQDCNELNQLIATLHRNRAIVKLKTNDARGCEQDCTAGK